MGVKSWCLLDEASHNKWTTNLTMTQSSMRFLSDRVCLKYLAVSDITFNFHGSLAHLCKWKLECHLRAFLSQGPTVHLISSSTKFPTRSLMLVPLNMCDFHQDTLIIFLGKCRKTCHVKYLTMLNILPCCPYPHQNGLGSFLTHIACFNQVLWKINHFSCFCEI